MNKACSLKYSLFWPESSNNDSVASSSFPLRKPQQLKRTNWFCKFSTSESFNKGSLQFYLYVHDIFTAYLHFLFQPSPINAYVITIHLNETKIHKYAKPIAADCQR